MPGIPYLELESSLGTKELKIVAIQRCYRLYDLIRGFIHPDQEFMYCCKSNPGLLDQYSRLPPDCCDLRSTQHAELGKTLLAKYVQSEVFFPICSYVLT
jgi:hypothetical protein